ncbi:MAG: GNAT family N-acetyltransferase [Deltaproteobacteria bacterium]|nr:GNAT family N-acetyltransferase [Deltaproteobacteria bacterium]
MNFGAEFVELDKAVHDRDSFNCGENELNLFLKTQAAKHMKVGISKTMLLPAVAPLSNNKYPICSFYTVAPSSIKRTSLPTELAKKLPHYPVPVFLLAQLAVHKDYHGQGLGKVTLIKALEYLWKINYRMSAFAIVVDCLNKNIEQFYAKYGFEKLCCHDEKTRMFIPMKIVAELF